MPGKSTWLLIAAVVFAAAVSPGDSKSERADSQTPEQKHEKDLRETASRLTLQFARAQSLGDSLDVLGFRYGSWIFREEWCVVEAIVESIDALDAPTDAAEALNDPAAAFLRMYSAQWETKMHLRILRVIGGDCVPGPAVVFSAAPTTIKTDRGRQWDHQVIGPGDHLYAQLLVSCAEREFPVLVNGGYYVQAGDEDPNWAGLGDMYLRAYGRITAIEPRESRR